MFIFEPFTALAAGWGVVELGAHFAQIEIQNFEKIGAMGLLGIMIWFSMLRQEKVQSKHADHAEKISVNLTELSGAIRELKDVVVSNKCKAKDQ